MANDPGLAGDTCIFQEAVSGDGGVHNAPEWWLSPDLTVLGSPSGNVAAGPNTIQVRTHWKNDCSVSAGSVLMDVYVGNPSLVMRPNDAGSTRLVAQAVAAGLTAGSSVVTNVAWTPDTDSTKPDGPGHRCLISRCYPDSLNPDPGSFYLPDDQHYAQHNICIVVCGGPGAARVPGLCGFDVTTANAHDERPEAATIHVKADLRPNQTVSRALLPRLERIPGFKKIASRPVNNIDMKMFDFPDAKPRDVARAGCLASLLGMKGAPAREVSIKLEPKQVTKFGFTADLAGAEFGDAYIFHLTHVGPDRKVHGGLTLVMIAG